MASNKHEKIPSIIFITKGLKGEQGLYFPKNEIRYFDLVDIYSKTFCNCYK